MALEIKLNQKLSQSLVMTPQLQQAIKLLQLGRAEYLEMIEKELLENPVLEDGREESGGLVESQASTADKQVVEVDELLRSEGQPTEESFEQSEALGDGFRAESMYSQGDFDSYVGDSQANYRATRQFDDDEDRPSLEATLSKPEGLAGHLLWQLRITDLSPPDQDIAVLIIGNLDRNGYLCSSTAEIAEGCMQPVEDVERVLKLIQSLDPCGVGARDLRECLLIQLDQLGLSEGLCYQIVQEHLANLEYRRYDQIAREMSVSVENVYEAIKQIQRLEPRPGRPFSDETPVYITPDIFVRKVGDEYVIVMNETGMPRLRLNPRYRELLSTSEGKNNPDREYVQECLKSAAWLIKSVHQRQRTIYRVTESIVKFQKEFLDKGVAFMKPMVLRDVADDVGMHESTVSRVTTNKFVHTPQGVFELKFFFSSGLKSGQGEVSSESVKQRILDLISAEDQRKPMSDQGLVEILRSEGIDIARRTVAKYREALNILSSSRRKKVF